MSTEDGSTYALDLTDGSLGWRSVPPVPALFYSLRLTPVPGVVLTASADYEHPRRSYVYANDAETGRLRWTRPAVSVLGADRDLTLLRTVHLVEAVDTRSGALRWRRPASKVGARTEAQGAALSPGTVVLPQPGAPVLGLERSTGRIRWRGPETMTALKAGDVVVVTTSDGLTALDPATGAVHWRLPVERSHQELAVAPDGELLLLDSDLVPHLGK